MRLSTSATESEEYEESLADFLTRRLFRIVNPSLLSSTRTQYLLSSARITGPILHRPDCFHERRDLIDLVHTYCRMKLVLERSFSSAWSSCHIASALSDLRRTKIKPQTKERMELEQLPVGPCLFICFPLF